MSSRSEQVIHNEFFAEPSPPAEIRDAGWVYMDPDNNVQVFYNSREDMFMGRLGPRETWTNLKPDLNYSDETFRVYHIVTDQCLVTYKLHLPTGNWVRTDNDLRQYVLYQDTGEWGEIRGTGAAGQSQEDDLYRRWNIPISRRNFIKIAATGAALLGVRFLWLLATSGNNQKGSRVYLPSAFKGEAVPEEPPLPDSVLLPVDILGQQDKPWGGELLGLNVPGSGGTIGGYGCLVTGIAEVQRFFGTSDATPKTVNDQLMATNGFSYQGFINRSRLAQNIGFRQVWESNDYTSAPFDEPMDDMSLTQLRELLAAGIPVIARSNLDDNPGGKEHYIVIAGYNKDTAGKWEYTFNDPWTADQRTLGEPAFARKVWKMWGYVPESFDTQTLPTFVTVSPRTEVTSDQPGLLPETVPFETFNWAPLGKSYHAADWPNVCQWEGLITTYLQKTHLQGVTLEQYVRDQGLNPEVWAAVIIWLESRGYPDAKNSGSGATGLGQVMPSDGVSAGYMCQNGPCFAGRPTSEALEDPELNMQVWMQDMADKIKAYGFTDGMNHYGNNPGYGDLVIAFHNAVLGK